MAWTDSWATAAAAIIAAALVNVVTMKLTSPPTSPIVAPPTRPSLMSPGTEAERALEPAPEEPASAWQRSFEVDGAPDRESLETEALIRSAFADPSLPGVLVDSVTCHANICKTELVFSDAETDKRVIRRVLMTPDSKVMKDMGVAIPIHAIERDGRVSASLYFYRRRMAALQTRKACSAS